MESAVCSMISSVTSGCQVGRMPMRFLSNSITRGSKMHYRSTCQHVTTGTNGTLHTMGARIISSYARSPYFSIGRSGLRTTKSYKLSATSPYSLMNLNRRPQRLSWKAHLGKSAQPGFQVFHDIPVIPSRKVDISVREVYAFKQNIKKFSDIVASHIQTHPVASSVFRKSLNPSHEIRTVYLLSPDLRRRKQYLL